MICHCSSFKSIHSHSTLSLKVQVFIYEMGSRRFKYGNLMFTEKYQQVNQRQLDDLDKALQIVRGNFVAAAKLIDCERR